MVLTLQKIYQDTNKCRKSRKQNKYQNKRQIPYGDNRRPSNCITEEYLQSDKHVEISKKKKRILQVNRNYAVLTAFGKKYSLLGTVT